MNPSNRTLTMAVVVIGSCLGGCAVVDSTPLWLVAKASGVALTTAASTVPSSAVNTVRHEHPAVAQVCIAFNPDCQVGDLIPALQAELKGRQIESRVYDTDRPLDQCTTWLKYNAYIDWDTPPFGSSLKQYIKSATVTMSTNDGRIIAGGSYVVDDTFSIGKWSSTRNKLSPIVAALVGNDEFKGFNEVKD